MIIYRVRYHDGYSEKEEFYEKEESANKRTIELAKHKAIPKKKLLGLDEIEVEEN